MWIKILLLLLLYLEQYKRDILWFRIVCAPQHGRFKGLKTNIKEKYMLSLSLSTHNTIVMMMWYGILIASINDNTKKYIQMQVSGIHHL